MKRDARADLAICEAATPEAWIIAARQVGPYWIRRAQETESREDSLVQEITNLRNDLDQEYEARQAAEARVRELRQNVIDMRDNVILERERRERVEAQAAVMRDALRKAKDALNAPTHEAKGYNCQDWPPGKGCRGCDGDELREQVVKQIESVLSTTTGRELLARLEKLEQVAEAALDVVADHEDDLMKWPQVLDSAYDLAATYKAHGYDRFRAWSQFVIDRQLKPEMDAGDFYKIFDKAPAMNIVQKTVVSVKTGALTHILQEQGGVERRVEITEWADGYVRWIDEHGISGSTPRGLIEQMVECGKGSP